MDLEIRGQVKTIQITTLLRSARILRILETRRLAVTHSSEKPSANAAVGDSKKRK